MCSLESDAVYDYLLYVFHQLLLLLFYQVFTEPKLLCNLSYLLAITSGDSTARLNLNL